VSVFVPGFTDTNPVSSLDGHTFRLAFANMRQVLHWSIVSWLLSVFRNWAGFCWNYL